MNTVRPPVALFITLAVIGALPPTAGADVRPNILWICADDHAPYVMGAYGNRRARTPNLDRLAASGMRFDRAYCNSPICTASRQSFITGRYPRTIGVTELKTALPQGETTLAQLLRSAGYRTAAIGKMHFNSPHTHGFDRRIDLSEYQAWLARDRRTRLPLPPGTAVLPPWKPFKDPARIWLNSLCRPVGAVDAEMDGTYFASEAERFLSEPRDRPFFMIVSFYEPHSPFHFPIEDRGRFDPATFCVAGVGPEDDWQIPAVFRDLAPAEKQGITAAYYTSVEFLDRNVGRVLGSLERSGQAGNTLVIYTGDHGYLLGQHGRFEKHCSFEEAIRSPLLLRYPRRIRPGRTTSALVELIDLVPTVLDLCGVSNPSTIQGRSLASLLSGATDKHRAHVFVEYAPNDEACVRDERWKLIYERGKTRRTDGYDTGSRLPGRTIRLYDLAADPAEMHNLAGLPAHAPRVRRMLSVLADHLKSTARQPELVPATSDLFELLDFCVQPRDVAEP